MIKISQVLTPAKCRLKDGTTDNDDKHNALHLNLGYRFQHDDINPPLSESNVVTNDKDERNAEKRALLWKT